MTDSNRIKCLALHDRVMTADQAAALINNQDVVAMSGFTGAGYPKEVPQALARRIAALKEKGEGLRINLWTGASTAPELDGALAEVDGVDMRLPYQGDPVARKRINAGDMHYMDYHLSDVAPLARYGFLGKINVAVIEVTAIREDGSLIPSSSVGTNNTWIDLADKVILEVNHNQNIKMEGMHDVFDEHVLPPNRKPFNISNAADRIGTPYLRCPAEKIVAIVETNAPDRNSPFKPVDEDSKRIAAHILDFFEAEVKAGRMPEQLFPLQSGVGNIANAVLDGLDSGRYQGLTSYTEVVQDGMLRMLKSGTLAVASATSFSLSPEGNEEFQKNIDFYREKIILRQSDVSNHPEIIRRLGTIGMNGIIEADIYGNVNSTHVMGTGVMNGIGGSGDFARNGALSIFMTPSLVKGGDISAIVPMVSHVDHTEHDVKVIVTEQGLADLRGLSPRRRAELIIEKCAHPDYRDELRDYFERACNNGRGQHTPHIMGEALSWHERFEQTGSMKK